MLNVKQKPTAAPPAKTAVPAASNPASAQAAAAFSAHLKKTQAEQAQRAAKQHRRDAMHRTPAANEPSLQQSDLMTALDDVDERSGGGQQNQQRQDQHDQQEQQQQSWLQTEQRLVALDRMDELAAETLAEHLAAMSEDDGLFDIVQADDTTLSVAVTRSAARVSLLLSTTSAETSAQLQRCKMELEQRLGRRIGKDVVVAIL